MAFLTSFRFKGVEFNDGTNFLLDTRGSNFDDQNPVEATYAPRKGNTPQVVGATQRETTVQLSINLVARTAADLDARIATLRRVFDPTDTREFLLERKRPTEAAYRTLRVAVRGLNIDRTGRKATATLQTADMRWEEPTTASALRTAFSSGFVEEWFLTYNGNQPVEPVLEVTPLTVGSDGPLPLYYREINVWAWEPARVLGYPIRLATDWDVNAEIAAGKIRTDLADMSITVGGQPQPHRISRRGTTSRIDIWIRPVNWPDYGKPMVGRRVDGAPISTIGAGDPTPFTLLVRLNQGNYFPLPSTSTIKIGDEFFVYDSPVRIDEFYYSVRITQRGVYGSPVQTHDFGAPVLLPTVVRVNYGYAPGFARTFPWLMGDNWPDINYETSSNAEWHFDRGTTRQQLNAWGEVRNGLNWRIERTPGTPTTRLRAQAISTADPLHGIRAGFETWYPSAAGSDTLRRLVLDHAGGNSLRVINQIRLWYQAPAGTTTQLRRIRSGYGTAFETGNQLWSGFSINGNSTLDTGWVVTDAWGTVPTHFVFENLAPVTGQAVRALLVTSFSLRWDAGFAPTPSGIGGEQGIGTGEFPVSFSLENVADGLRSGPFHITARMSVNQTGRIDCATRAVTGDLQTKEVSYQLSSWLRLVPGENRIVCRTSAGSGQVRLLLTWQARH